ncbi:MAG: ornithine carbamoyltransferase [Desulfobacterota bacterium]|nr:ornithine carbamoyltransferase [Thermodesulfobacteriota bacterium]
MQKDLLNLYDLTKKDFDRIFKRTATLKRMHQSHRHYHPLRGKTLGMIFEKPSTRTRVSFEVGMFQLGGHALYLRWTDTQLGRGESIADTARVLSRYLDGVMIRTFQQAAVEEFAQNASVPVINGLTDLYHPCQILADLFTVIERHGTYKGRKVTYIGDGNNIANTWIDAALRLEFDLTLACPHGYTPDPDVLHRAQQEASSQILLVHDPWEAVRGADVVITDTWVSMGQEKLYRERIKAFKGFQVNQQLLHFADPQVIVLHCLPAHRGEEITDEVMDGPHSAVFDEAENRLHVQKAILELLMADAQRLRK